MSSARRWGEGGLSAALAVLAFAAAGMAGSNDGCGSGCGSDCSVNGPPCGHCPPPYKHWIEGPPCIKFRCGCPKPVCDPCSYEHAGYWMPCWQPWSFPPDWSHCPTPPPSARIPPPIPLSRSPAPGVTPVPPVPRRVPLSGEPDLPLPRTADINPMSYQRPVRTAPMLTPAVTAPSRPTVRLLN